VYFSATTGPPGPKVTYPYTSLPLDGLVSVMFYAAVLTIALQILHFRLCVRLSVAYGLGLLNEPGKRKDSAEQAGLSDVSLFKSKA